MSRIEVDSDHWYTPVDILRRVLATFDNRPVVDPCTCREAYRTLPEGVRDLVEPKLEPGYDFLADEYFEAERGFLNSPYSKAVGGTGAFTDHLIECFRHGRVNSAIVLVNASTDTKWWHRLADASVAICFVEGRIKFDSVLDGQRVPGNQPRYANCIHLVESKVFGIYQPEFEKQFRDIGTIR